MLCFARLERRVRCRRSGTCLRAGRWSGQKLSRWTSPARIHVAWAFRQIHRHGRLCSRRKTQAQPAQVGAKSTRHGAHGRLWPALVLDVDGSVVSPILLLLVSVDFGERCCASGLLLFRKVGLSPLQVLLRLLERGFECSNLFTRLFKLLLRFSKGRLGILKLFLQVTCACRLKDR